MVENTSNISVFLQESLKNEGERDAAVAGGTMGSCAGDQQMAGRSVFLPDSEISFGVTMPSETTDVVSQSKCSKPQQQGEERLSVDSKMSLIMDNRIERMDKEAEVKKLQALVKQLELQNEELRSERQQLMKDGGGGGESPLSTGGRSSKEHTPEPGTPKHQQQYNQQEEDRNLDTMDPIGLDDSNLSDEETW